MAQIAFLKINKTFIFVLTKYTDFVDMFFKDLIIQLSEHIIIYDYTTN